MIENEQQYKITLAQIAHFEQALALQDIQECEIPLALRKAQRDALTSQISSLRDQINDFLKSKQIKQSVRDFFDFHINSVLDSEVQFPLDETDLIRRILDSLNSNWETWSS